MKKFKLPAILLCSLNLVVVHAAEPANATATKSSEAAPSAHEKKQLEAYGWIMGKQIVDGSVGQFGFNDAEKAVLIQGVIKGAQGQGTSPITSKEDGDALEKYLEGKATAQQKVSEAELTKQIESGKAAAKAYFDKLAKEGKAKKTDSGLFYEIIKEGSKETPKGDSTVEIDYVGTLLDGTEFDSSKKRGQSATFNLGQVIPGFKEGLQLIGKGGKIRLYVPSDLAYGDNALPGIPAGSTLVFDVDMIDVKPVDTQTTK
jgi:FKBP-type peptidyl-prolyl cis-trans isomerase